jgi:DNA (cytosine-5)-methyltransferase 1
MPGGGTVAEAVKADLEGEGYGADFAVLTAASYGVPQRRKRVFFLGVRDGGSPVFPPGTRGCPGTARTLGAVLPVPPDVPDQEVMPLERSAAAMIAHVPEGGSWKDVPDRFLPPRLLRIKADMSRHHPPKIFRRFARTEICGTVTASARPDKSFNIHPAEDRGLSVREFARIQSFPDDFRFPALPGRLPSMYRVIGNAVPPLLARRLAEHLLATYVRTVPAARLTRHRIF